MADLRRVTIAAADSVLLALNVLLGVPAELTPWALGSLVLVPFGLLGGQLPGTAPAGEQGARGSERKPATPPPADNNMPRS